MDFAELCCAEVLHIQTQIEHEVSLLELHRLERSEEGASSRVTRLQIKRINKGRKTVRSLLLNWEYWWQLSHAGQILPQYAVEDTLKGTFPWRDPRLPMSGGGSASAAALKLKLHRVKAELARSQEELQYIPGDAANSLNLYRYQIQRLSRAMLCHLGQDRALATGQLFLLRGILRKVLNLEKSARLMYAQKLDIHFS